MTKESRLSKPKRNVLRRDDYFYFHHYSFQYALLTKRDVVNMTGYMAKFLFCILLDFLKVLYLILSWLVMPRDFFARSLRDLMHWSSLRSLVRTYAEWSTCGKSSIVFTDTRSAAGKKNDANIRHLHISQNAPNLCPKILHKHYCQFLLGWL